ncbi:MAG: hypothetical protein IPK26_20375 [Planctomycetes bacterium]|nr:hypothetical protein [Planctomycetota bacterium]
MSLLCFADRPRLFAFAEVLGNGTFDGLDGLEFVAGPGNLRHALRVPQPRLAEVSRELLEHHGASEVDDRRIAGVPLTTLHARVELLAAPQRVLPAQLLVLPISPRGPFTARQLGELIADLAETDDFQASLWPVAFVDEPGRQLTLLRLDARVRLAAGRAPTLTGRPWLLGGDTEGRTFLPLGHRHPFVPAHPFLFPPLPDDVLRLWMPVLDQERVRWRMCRVRPLAAEPRPLAFGVEVTTEVAAGSVQVPALPERIAVPVVLGPDLADRQTRELRRVRCLHRYRSEAGALGSRLRQLLDLAEAGARDLQWFAGPRAEECAGDHFVLDQRLVEAGADHAVAGETIYWQPEGFVRAGLPVFVQRGSWFRPALDRLLAGLDDDQGLLAELRARFGLADDPDAIAVVEPGASPEVPRVLVLSGGQPMASVVQWLLDRFDDGRVRVAADAAMTGVRTDLTVAHREFARLVDAECGDLEAGVERALTALGEAGASFDDDLHGTEARVAALGDLLAFGDAEFARGAAAWRDVADAVFATEKRLAAQRVEWLALFHAKEQDLAAWQAARAVRGTVLREWCEQRLARMQERHDQIETSHREIEKLATTVTDMATAADGLHERLAAELPSLAERFEAWSRRLGELQTTLEAQTAQARTRAAELSAKEREQTTQQEHVERELVALDQRLLRLTGEEAALQRRNERLELQRARVLERQRSLEEKRARHTALLADRAARRKRTPGA